MAQAIEASLNTSIAEDKFEELQNEHRIRHDKRPVALRCKDQSRCYAALLLQSLFFIPQIRSRISKWMVDEYTERPKDPPEVVPFTLAHLFTYMDLAILSYIIIDDSDLPDFFKPPTSTSAADVPGFLTSGQTCRSLISLRIF